MQVLANMLRGHAVAYRAIHQIQPEARVGYAHHHRPMVAKRSWSPLDALMRNIRYMACQHGFPLGIQHRRDEDAVCENSRSLKQKGHRIILA